MRGVQNRIAGEGRLWCLREDVREMTCERSRNPPGYVAEEVCSAWAGIGAVERVFPLGTTRPVWASMGTPGDIRQHGELLGITGHHQASLSTSSRALDARRQYKDEKYMSPAYKKLII